MTKMSSTKMKGTTSVTITTGSPAGFSGTSSTTNYGDLNQWSEPNMVSLEEVGDTIEMIFTQYSTIHYCNSILNRSPKRRVFKIIYSCINGKWNKSDRIFGEIILATNEDYIFD